MEEVLFTPEKLRRFKKVYANAYRGRADFIVFEGREYHTGYAKYLIEFLTSQFDGKDKAKG